MRLNIAAFSQTHTHTQTYIYSHTHYSSFYPSLNVSLEDDTQKQSGTLAGRC